MNLTVNSQLLAQELRLVNHVLPNKPALPVLANVLLYADADHSELNLYGTDLEVGFSTSCQASVGVSGRVTLPGKKLLELVEQFTDADVTITLDKNHVRVSSGTFKSRLQTFRADDFPQMPSSEGVQTTLGGIAFQSLISHVRYAISERTAKYVIDGALLTLTDSVAGVAALVATDGKRLSLMTMPKGDGPAMSAVLPSKALDALRLQFSGNEDIQFSESHQHLFFTAGDRQLFTRRLEATFPKYDRIIPREHDKKVTINRVALAAALQRVGLVSDTNQATHLYFEPGSLLMQSSSAELGDASEHLPIDYEGTPVKVCLNWTFLRDFLNAAVGQSVVVEFKDSNSPLLLTDGSNFINVVMLMRV